MTQTRVAPSRYPDNNPKSALGVLKPGFHAIPPVALLSMARGYGGGLHRIPPVALLHLGAGMEDGRRKYGIVNWRGNSVAGSVYLNAALRHIFAFRDGEDYAQDSKVHHLGHTLSCCAIILDAKSSGNLIDDRGAKGTFPDMALTRMASPAARLRAVTEHLDDMVAFLLAWWDGQDSVVFVPTQTCHPLGLVMAHGGLILDGLEAYRLMDDRPGEKGHFSAAAARMAAELKERAAQAAAVEAAEAAKEAAA